MKTKFLATASVLALMLATPALADSKSNTTQPSNEGRVEQQDKTLGESAKEAWNGIKKDTAEAYEDIKATVVGSSKDGKFSTVTLNSRNTATGIIGKAVYNANGESVAKVNDIILDRDGKAIMVVVSDGEFIGLGKKAAFDYSTIASINAEGDVIMPLTEEMIDNAAEFSYNREDYSDKVRVIPSNGYSVNALLDAQLVDPQNETVAEIDNISFKNGKADQLIVGFDKILGMGGEKAAVAYSDPKLIPDGNGFDFQLNADQAAQFKQFKDTATN